MQEMDGGFTIVVSGKLQRPALILLGHRGMVTYGIWLFQAASVSPTANTVLVPHTHQSSAVEPQMSLLEGDHHTDHQILISGGDQCLLLVQHTPQDLANQRSVGSGTTVTAHFQLVRTSMLACLVMVIHTWATAIISMLIVQEAETNS